MEDKKLQISISDILLVVIGVVFCIGSKTVFVPCDPMEDGSWMSCHWAGEAIFGASLVMLVIALLHLFMKDARVKCGLSLALIPVALYAICIPGVLISLCMMDTMRCHAVMRPAATLLSVLMIAAAVFDLFSQRKK